MFVKINKLIMKQKFTLLLFTIFTTLLVVNKSSAQITDLNVIKALYTGTATTIPSGYFLNGVVISDTINKNVSAANTIVQANGTGIIIYFGKGAGHYYNAGDSISLDLTGWGLTAYNGADELTPPTGTTSFPPPVATGVVVTPMVVTIDYLNNNYNQIAYTMLLIHHAIITSTSGVFTGSNNLTDATGTIVLYTGANSTFIDSTLPADTMDFVGYATIYKTAPEFDIRSFSEIHWALPISFKAFSVEAKGTTALLSWSTANEVNSSKIAIEKSLDGINYASLGTVPSKGKPSNSYVFTDASNKSGTVAYYRLKSIDNAGSFAYSSVQKVAFSAATKLTAYPNPTSGTTKLSYVASTTDAIVRVLSIDGKVVKQVNLKAGTTTTDLQLAGLAKGIYTVETGNNTIKIAKN